MIHPGHASCALALVVVLLAPGTASAQLSVVPEPSPRGRLRLGDLWNASITNPGPGAQSAFLRVQVRRDGGELALDAHSGAIEFATGTRTVRSRDLEPIEVLQTGAGVDQALSRSGEFPAGRYTVCLEAFAPGGTSLGASACLDVEVATVMPPLPMQPPNGGTTSQPFILWTWFMQPASGAGEPVACDLRVAEVMPGQTPEEALRRNPAVLLREGLRSSVWQTNEAVRALRHGTTYAWRLTAKVDGRVASESEIWTFTYLAPESEEEAPGGAAASLTAPGDTTAAGGVTPAPGLRPVEWNAVARSTVESSNRPGALSQGPGRYARLEVDPTLTIYGSPLALNLLVSTERDPQGSGIQRGLLGFDGANGFGLDLNQRIEGRVRTLEKSRTELLADSARMVLADLERVQQELDQLYALRPLDPSQTSQELEQLGLLAPSEAAVFRIPSFGFGSVAPDFGRMFLSGVTVNGGMVEHNPGRFYGALVLGKLPREDNGLVALPVSAADGTRADLFQDMYSARIGLGRKTGDHLILSGLYARDDRQTRAILSLADPAQAPAVQENVVVGIAGRTRQGNRQLVLDGDLQAGVFSDDRGGPELRNRPVPAGLRSLFGGRIRESSAADWAGGLRGALDLRRWNAKLASSVRFVGPGYITLGVRGLRRDNLQVEGSWQQSWREGRWSFGTQWGNDRTGVVLPQSGFANVNRFGARFAGRPTRLPAIELAYDLNDQRQRAGGDDREISSRSNLVSARLRQTGRVGSVGSLTMLVVDRLLGSSNDATASHQASAVRATQMFSLPSRVGLLMLGSRTRTVTALANDRDADVWGWEGSVSWARGEWLDVSAGITGSMSESLRQNGGFVGARCTLGRIGALDLHWSINQARAVTSGALGFTDRIFRVQFLTHGQPGNSPTP